MVKADYRRDYYADLDLPNTAEPEVIKKRFRELGTKIHGSLCPAQKADHFQPSNITLTETRVEKWT